MLAKDTHTQVKSVRALRQIPTRLVCYESGRTSVLSAKPRPFVFPVLGEIGLQRPARLGLGLGVGRTMGDLQSWEPGRLFTDKLSARSLSFWSNIFTAGDMFCFWDILVQEYLLTNRHDGSNIFHCPPLPSHSTLPSTILSEKDPLSNFCDNSPFSIPTRNRFQSDSSDTPTSVNPVSSIPSKRRRSVPSPLFPERPRSGNILP